jgi:hypothetical protein
MLAPTQIVPMTSQTLRASTALLGLCLALSVASCRRAQKHALPDVTKSAKLTLSKQPTQGNIHALHIDVVGEIDGSATLNLRHPGEPTPRTITIHGTFSQKLFGSDWYADTADLEYIPSGVTRGNVRFRYDFSD